MRWAQGGAEASFAFHKPAPKAESFNRSNAIPVTTQRGAYTSVNWSRSMWAHVCGKQSLPSFFVVRLPHFPDARLSPCLHVVSPATPHRIASDTIGGIWMLQRAYFIALCINFDIIVLTEIWNSHISFYCNILPTYNFHYMLPIKGIVGGVGIFFNQALECSENSSFCLKSSEVMLVENIWLSNKKNSYWGNIPTSRSWFSWI